MSRGSASTQAILAMAQQICCIRLCGVALLVILSVPQVGQAALHRFPLSRLRCDDSGANVTLCDLYHGTPWQFDLGVPSLLESVGPPAGFPEVKAPLQNNFNLVYTVIAQIGEPPVNVRLIVDTGSSDLWVKASSVAAPFGTMFGGGRVYDGRKSSTAGATSGRQVTVSYGQGRVLGVEVSDRICVSGLCIANQSFIFAKDVFGIPDQWLFDGILGLGYPALALDRFGTTFLQSLNATFRHLAVGFSLGGPGLGRPDEPGLGGGYLSVGEFGELRAEAVDQLGEGVTLQLYGINRQAMFWLVQTSIAVMPLDHKLSGQHGDPQEFAAALAGPDQEMAILDSGTSLLTAPGNAYLALVDAMMFGRTEARQKCTTTLLSAWGQLVCMCDTELNPITFSLTGLDGRRFQVTLKAEDLKQTIGVGAVGPGVCRIAVMPSPPGMPLWILGDVFLRHVYVVHDVVRHRVELFPQRGSRAAAILEPELPVGRPAAAAEATRHPEVLVAPPAAWVAWVVWLCMVFTVTIAASALVVRRRREQSEDAAALYSRL